MEQTSLQKFNSFIDSDYPELKKYIISSNDKRIILEDHGNYAFGKNPDLKVLFEIPCMLPVANMNVEYREKDGMFIIFLDLK